MSSKLTSNDLLKGRLDLVQISVPAYRKCMRKWLQVNRRENWTIEQVCERLERDLAFVMRKLGVNSIIVDQPLLNQIPED